MTTPEPIPALSLSPLAVAAIDRHDRALLATREVSRRIGGPLPMPGSPEAVALADARTAERDTLAGLRLAVAESTGATPREAVAIAYRLEAAGW